MLVNITGKTLNIGVDFDGVIVNTIKLKHKLAKQMYGIEGIENARFKEYMVVEDGHMTREQYRKLMNIVCGDLKFGLEMEDIEYAIKYISLLRNLGHKVISITSRENNEVKIAQKWCEARKLDIDIISTGYNKDKKDVARGLDIYIDDDLPKLIPLTDIVPNLFLLSQEHNLNHNVPKGIVRVSSWFEFYKKLQALIYEK